MLCDRTWDTPTKRTPIAAPTSVIFVHLIGCSFRRGNSTSRASEEQGKCHPALPSRGREISRRCTSRVPHHGGWGSQWHESADVPLLTSENRNIHLVSSDQGGYGVARRVWITRSRSGANQEYFVETQLRAACSSSRFRGSSGLAPPAVTPVSSSRPA